MSKGMLGLVLAGLGLVGIIFTGLTYFSHVGFYGATGMGKFHMMIPGTFTILLIIVGLILMFSSKDLKELNR